MKHASPHPRPPLPNQCAPRCLLHKVLYLQLIQSKISLLIKLWFTGAIYTDVIFCSELTENLQMGSGLSTFILQRGKDVVCAPGTRRELIHESSQQIYIGCLLDAQRGAGGGGNAWWGESSHTQQGNLTHGTSCVVWGQRGASGIWQSWFRNPVP